MCKALLIGLFVVNYVLGCNCLYPFPYGLHNPLGLRPALLQVQAESPQSFPSGLTYSKSYTPGVLTYAKSITVFPLLTYTKSCISGLSHY